MKKAVSFLLTLALLAGLLSAWAAGPAGPSPSTSTTRLPSVMVN